jgi:hypothetical protein
MFKPAFIAVVSALAVAVLVSAATGLEAAGARKGHGETMQPAAGAPECTNKSNKCADKLSAKTKKQKLPAVQKVLREPPPPKPKDEPKEDCMSCAD